jgi:hypothetical protein
MREQWAEIFLASFRDVVQRLALVAPRLLAALSFLLLGWVVGALARRLTERVLRTVDLDGRCARWGLVTALEARGFRQSPSEVVGRVAFWAVFVVGLLMGLEALETPATAGLANVAIWFLPNLLVAALVMVVGWLFAHFLARAVLIAVVNAQWPGASAMAAATRWLVLVVAGAVALTQLGIGREMVLLVFGISFGGTVLALALAFGLGGRDLAREALEGWVREHRAKEESDRISHV